MEFHRKLDYTIKREKYLQQLIKARDNGFPKVITGIRRCGKSYLLNQIYKDYLIASGVKKENIIEMNMTMVSNCPCRFLINCYSVNMKKMSETVGPRHLFC